MRGRADGSPWSGAQAKPLFRKCNNSAFTYFIDGIPKDVPVRGFVSLRTVFTPDVGGTVSGWGGACGVG
jgi:beta-glucosidase